MKSKQVLSVEQMKHLQEIGLELRNTSMLLWYKQMLGKIPISDWELSVWRESLFSEDHVYPAYTLQDILDKLPCFIGNEVLTIQKLADSYTCLYMEPYSRSMINITESKELIDAVYDMLCWCIENGYVKVGKEE
ncbi:hypothetical protein F2Z17_04820 [Bacteroides finegoldii]|jgi:hypothetical protein|uniref:hypothetical protein n=2 Tax=Bacteroides finegoldii TaxID=338188 RepID=UPI001230B755|nr:hypothetical protein [Bacteroides finegoldii]DAH05814.1 MAG TPA: hypothetical protein [Caudoviricetes sp.]KAA5219985.1 hypothetical protein F2Z28_01195 [Bacteroides finegoldii]KAA5223862.1 hypothetical protein F2Z16_01195 [Bacteroides finegoldii]KAA5235868.1 hypothetical protein F2Z17_04820 [Bacteroides finegoldii]KAA5242912.1 hypothetical protein F2Z15_01200 [Bacteroides finegoldii]